MKTINKILTICLVFNSMNIIGQCTPTTITDECSEGNCCIPMPMKSILSQIKVPHQKKFKCSQLIIYGHDQGQFEDRA